jgi:hypothetical protein
MRVERVTDMPLGGYCEICQRWVWVSAYGECENGHPQTAVRDVQQLQPQKSRALSMGQRHEPVVVARSARYRWWWRHSLWMLWVFSFGLFDWVAFLYIGARAKSAVWIAAGLMYLLPVVAMFATIGTPWLRLTLPLMALFWVLAIVNAFIARPRYRAIMFGDLTASTRVSPPQPPALASIAERPALPRSLDAEAVEVIRGARDQVDEIVGAADAIQKPEVRAQVTRLCGTAEEILDELAREPRQIQLARAFLAYYLQAAQRIVTGYAELLRNGSSSASAAESLARAEASLASIQRAFDDQREALLEHRVIDLDSEVAVLEKTVRMSGVPTSDGRR